MEMSTFIYLLSTSQEHLQREIICIRLLCKMCILYEFIEGGFGMMNVLRDRVFNTTFNNISAISWQSILLVEETGVPGENH